MRQKFLKNINKTVSFHYSVVKAPPKGFKLFDDFYFFIVEMVSLFYSNLYSRLYFSGLSPVSI